MKKVDNDCCRNTYNITTDCRSEEGVTVGLIDSLISICRVLATHDLDSYNASEALLDLIEDEDFNKILDKGLRVRFLRGDKSFLDWTCR